MDNNRPTWVVFDIGGVLLDWMSSSQAFAQSLQLTHDQLFNALYDLGVQENIGTRMNTGTLSGQKGWDIVLGQFQAQLPFRDIVAAWTAQPYWPEDTLSLLRDIKRAGYKMAIFSNSWFGLTDPDIQALLPAELQLFDEIIDSAVEKTQKPDPVVYRRLEKRIGVDGGAILFIDDDRKNIDTASSLGWQTYLYTMGPGGSEIRPNNDSLRSLLLS